MLLLSKARSGNEGSGIGQHAFPCYPTIDAITDLEISQVDTLGILWIDLVSHGGSCFVPLLVAVNQQHPKSNGKDHLRDRTGQHDFRAGRV